MKIVHQETALWICGWQVLYASWEHLNMQINLILLL